MIFYDPALLQRGEVDLFRQGNGGLGTGKMSEMAEDGFQGKSFTVISNLRPHPPSLTPSEQLWRTRISNLRNAGRVNMEYGRWNKGTPVVSSSFPIPKISDIRRGFPKGDNPARCSNINAPDGKFLSAARSASGTRLD
jgi:hypothetical protein